MSIQSSYPTQPDPQEEASVSEAAQEQQEVDLTESESDQDNKYLVPKIRTKKFDEGEHRARIAGHAMIFLCALIGFIVVSTFISLWKGYSIDDIDRVVFILITLISVFASPLVHFFFRNLD